MRGCENKERSKGIFLGKKQRLGIENNGQGVFQEVMIFCIDSIQVPQNCYHYNPTTCPYHAMATQVHSSWCTIALEEGIIEQDELIGVFLITFASNPALQIFGECKKFGGRWRSHTTCVCVCVCVCVSSARTYVLVCVLVCACASVHLCAQVYVCVARKGHPCNHTRTNTHIHTHTHVHTNKNDTQKQTLAHRHTDAQTHTHKH